MRQAIAMLKRVTVLSMFMTTIFLTGCKKDQAKEKNNPSIVGTWSNVTQVGSFRNTLTEYALKADGNGNELVMTITTGSSTIVSDEDFKWSSVDPDLLKLTFATGTADFTYTLSADAQTLTLTAANGNSKDYFRQD